MNLLSVTGRSTRTTWWQIHIIMTVLIIGPVELVKVVPSLEDSILFSLISIVIFASAVGMSIANNVKRYHDRNKSGWWFFIVLIPLIGPIWQFVELGFLKGTEEGNNYGPSPYVALIPRS